MSKCAPGKRLWLTIMRWDENPSDWRRRERKKFLRHMRFQTRLDEMKSRLKKNIIEWKFFDLLAFFFHSSRWKCNSRQRKFLYLNILYLALIRVYFSICWNIASMIKSRFYGKIVPIKMIFATVDIRYQI